MNIDLNRFAKEVHALAVKKGFYKPKPTSDELTAGIYSEISEAFEEWRAGRPLVWHQCEVHDKIMPCEKEKCCLWSNGICLEGRDGHKPEGVAVELVDVVLRILDAAVTWGMKVKPEDLLPVSDWDKTREQMPLPNLVVELHSMVYQAYMSRKYGFDCAIASIFTWIQSQGIDPEALLLEKHEYNKTRAYRHGGKRV